MPLQGDERCTAQPYQITDGRLRDEADRRDCRRGPIVPVFHSSLAIITWWAAAGATREA